MENILTVLSFNMKFLTAKNDKKVSRNPISEEYRLYRLSTSSMKNCWFFMDE
jgi:hypothetical protein